jgi:hypothetical protein
MPSGSSKFIARLLDGEAMSEVCRTFGISRKTGYSTAPAPSEGSISALTIRDIITAPIIADTATKARAFAALGFVRQYCLATT